MRDMVFADLVDGTATGRSFTLLTKLLNGKAVTVTETL